MELVKEVNQESGGKMMPYKNQWVRQGEAIGEARGKIKGTAETLLEILKVQFKEVPPSVEEQISKETNLTKLSSWVKQILQGKQLNEVFQ